MTTYNYTVRSGFAVTLGAPNSNDKAHATVYSAGQEVALTDDQTDSHLHKLEPFDAGATTKLAAIAGHIRPTKAFVV